MKLISNKSQVEWERLRSEEQKRQATTLAERLAKESEDAKQEYQDAIIAMTSKTCPMRGDKKCIQSCVHFVKGNWTSYSFDGTVYTHFAGCSCRLWNT